MLLRHSELTLKKFYLARSASCVVFSSARLVQNRLSMLLNVEEPSTTWVIILETGSIPVRLFETPRGLFLSKRANAVPSAPVHPANNGDKEPYANPSLEVELRSQFLPRDMVLRS